mmetsp:Transcript_102164/g.288574  ORF Transcript_102164/g.288574 Transcript_102164/m.288574 type:complete len:570 (-) Transcript_102164:250-1959(-)
MDAVSVGTPVVLVGLCSAPQLNGLVGTAVAFDDASGRWRVDLGDAGVKALKLENLEVLLSEGVRSTDTSAFGQSMALADLKETRPEDVSPRLRLGARVRLASLSASAHLNGLMGTVVELDGVSGRWRVDLGAHGIKALKAEHLEMRIADGTYRKVHSRNPLQEIEGWTCHKAADNKRIWQQSKRQTCCARQGLGNVEESQTSQGQEKLQQHDARHKLPASVLMEDTALEDHSLASKERRQPQQRLPPRILAQDEAFEASIFPNGDVVQCVERCIAIISKVARRLGARCVLFGSWAQDTPLKGSDVDVALVFGGQSENDTEHGKAERIQLLRCFRARAAGTTLHVVEEVFRARVPIIRMEFTDDCKLPLEVDVSVGNSRTGMLDDDILERVRALPCCKALLGVVKSWASRRHVNKALFGCLNSLSWTLLVLFFARADFPRGPIRVALEQFFEFVRGLGVQPDATRKLSVRKGCWLPREQCDDQALLWIEDPTLVANNTARSLHLSGWHATLDEIDRALAMCRCHEPVLAICSDNAPTRVELAPPWMTAELQGERRRESHDDGCSKRLRLG